MKAVVLKDKTILLSDENMPQRSVGEALIKINLAGICNTDIELMKGYMNYQGILGHEFVGKVVESDSDNLVGKRVVGEINIGCGECDWCLSSMSRHCPNRSVLGILNKNGVLAEYATLPEKNLPSISDLITEQQAVFTEPIAAAYEILEQFPSIVKEEVLLFGDGKLGQLIARVLNSEGIELLVVGKNEQKLNLLKQHKIKTRLLSQISTRQFPVVIDATGNIEGFELAMNCTKPRGTLILKSTVADYSGINLAPIVINEINICGSRCGPFEPAIRALKENKFPVQDLVTATFPISEYQKAFEVAKMSSSLKVIIDFKNGY